MADEAQHTASLLASSKSATPIKGKLASQKYEMKPEAKL
jgi:hypothetical protein